MEQNELLQQLRDEFLSLYTDKEELITCTKTTVYVKYVNLIGREELEIFNLDLELKALKMKVKMAQAYRNKKQMPDTAAIERRILLLWKEHEERLNSMISMLKCADDSISVSSSIIEDAKKIYRTLVKRLHPDLHPELSEELHDMLISAQAAYRLLDLNTLRQLVIKYELLTDSLKDEGCQKDEAGHISLLQEQIEKLKKSIDDLNSSFPLNLKEKLDDEEWVNEQQELMRTRKDSLKNEIAKQEDIYSLLIED